MQVYSHCNPLHLIPLFQEHELEQFCFTVNPVMPTGVNNLRPKTLPSTADLSQHLFNKIANIILLKEECGSPNA